MVELNTSIIFAMDGWSHPLCMAILMNAVSMMACVSTSEAL